MNTIIIDRLQEQYDSSNKSCKGKIMSGAKERATKQYFKAAASQERRKQKKVRFDTHRRSEQPTEEELRLEDIHFANFLGITRSEYGVPYNNVHINEPVNIHECDICLLPEASKNVPEKEAPQEDCDYINIKDYLLQRRTDSIIPDCGNETDSIASEEEWFDTRQIEREENAVPHMDLVYIPETKTLTSNGWYFKRGLENGEQSEAKRMRMSEEEQPDDVSLIGSEDEAWGIPVPLIENWESMNGWPAPEWQDNLKFCEERNKQEQQLFVEENPDVGRFTVECLQQAEEEANFAAMVAYMREQVELAEQIMEHELCPCDCNK